MTALAKEVASVVGLYVKVGAPDVLEVLVNVTERAEDTATALLKVTVVPEMEVTVVSSEIGVMTAVKVRETAVPELVAAALSVTVLVAVDTATTVVS